MPLTRPGLAATTLLILVLNWNEYLFAVFLATVKVQTMPIMVAAKNTGEKGVLWWEMCAVTVVMIIPVIIMSVLLTRFISKGVLLGAVKGVRMTGNATKASVRFDAVQKSFGNVMVLEEFNLEVQPGEFLVLLGGFRIWQDNSLANSFRVGDTHCRAGLYCRQDVTEVLPKYRDISMVFQSYALYPHKTVENIGFPLKVKKCPRRRWKRLFWMRQSKCSWRRF